MIEDGLVENRVELK